MMMMINFKGIFVVVYISSMSIICLSSVFVPVIFNCSICVAAIFLRPLREGISVLLLELGGCQCSILTVTTRFVLSFCTNR